MYAKLLRDREAITLPIQKSYARSVWWQYGILFPSERTRDRVARYLAKHNIETRTFFVPLHLQPAFSSSWGKKKLRFPVAESLSRRGLCLPSGLSMTNKQLEFVCDHIHRALKTI